MCRIDVQWLRKLRTHCIKVVVQLRTELVDDVGQLIGKTNAGAFQLVEVMLLARNKGQD